jgi:hypothetical protein
MPEFFTVTDTFTGKEPDIEEIARNEDWARELVWCDMEGFALRQDGTLVLLDECGNSAYCPPGRFKVVINTPDPIVVETSVLGAMH